MREEKCLSYTHAAQKKLQQKEGVKKIKLCGSSQACPCTTACHLWPLGGEKMFKIGRESHCAAAGSLLVLHYTEKQSAEAVSCALPITTL